MASLCLQFPVDCYKPGPTRPVHNGDPIASRLGVDPQLGKLFAPHLPPHPVSWVEAFLTSWNGEFDDNFVQFYYKVYAALNPDRVQVPPEYLEEFKQRRAVDCPDFWQIEEARACEACEASDVVPPPPPDPLALSAPPSGSRSEQAASTAAVRAADGAL